VWLIFAFDIYDLLLSRLIAIFLVVLKMTAKDALDEFSRFVIDIFKDIDRDPRKQTEKLIRTINSILERHGTTKDAKLIPTTQASQTCKL
jgi:hypothetical protein